MASDEWTEEAVLSLQTLCIETILDNLNYIADKDPFGHYNLKQDINLPLQICEALYDGLREHMLLERKTMTLFRDPTRTHLRSLNLDETCSKKNLDATLIEALIKHKPQEFHIGSFRRLLGNETLEAINENSHNLTSLAINLDLIKTSSPGATIPGIKVDNSYKLNCPKLKRLILRDFANIDFDAEQLHGYVCLLTRPLSKQLTVLDLSNSSLCISAFPELKELENLYSLYLYNTDLGDVLTTFNIIHGLRKLRVLDLSRSLQESATLYPNPELHMGSILSSLRHLTYLDLSGTNLAGYVDVQQEQQELRHRIKLDPKYEPKPVCMLPGLQYQKLKFLGLLGCADHACDRPNLPAEMVTGDYNEDQVLLSVKTYVDRTELLEVSLNNLFRIFRHDICRKEMEALDLILAAMYRHPHDQHIQICGSASLFYIAKGEKKETISRRTALKRRMIRALICAMENHVHEKTMMRNGSLTLCHFKIPQDVLFMYKRLVKVLLQMINPDNRPESFTQRVGIYLLNSLACQVDGKEKLMVGELGAIGIMLNIIRSMLYDSHQYNEVMEIAWSTMWNVTDETAKNCQQFIEGDGMNVFLECLEKHKEKEELLRNMMGLLGNVAEVDYLRRDLMTPEFVQVFSDLLESTSDGIEVSYNACGVLSHMMSDGHEAWTISTPSRQQVRAKMAAAISKWKLKTKRNINYRSFEPILRLLRRGGSDESQFWAVWALSNLTKMYRSKYCPLVEREGGIPLLEAFIRHDSHPQNMRQLATNVLSRCRASKGLCDYHSSGESSGEENELI